MRDLTRVRPAQHTIFITSFCMRNTSLLLACLSCPCLGRRIRRGDHSYETTIFDLHEALVGTTDRLDRQSVATVNRLASLAAIVLPFSPRHAFACSLAALQGLLRHPIASTTTVEADMRFEDYSITSRRRSRADAVMAVSEFAEFDSLLKDREDAEGEFKFEEAAAIRAELATLEKKKPMLAIRWHMKRRVDDRQQEALKGGKTSIRLTAIDSLKEMASPPMPIAGAEDALHTILRRTKGSDAQRALICEYAEEALWHAWQRSGDDALDQELQRGIRLMAHGELIDAMDSFSKVLEKKPDFAEALHKRALVFLVRQEYTRARADCELALEANPRHFGCMLCLGVSYLGDGNPNLLKVDELFEGLRWCRQALVSSPHRKNVQALVDEFGPKMEKLALLAQQEPLIDAAIADIRKIQRKIEVVHRLRKPELLAYMKNNMRLRIKKDIRHDAVKDVSCVWNVHRVRDSDMVEDDICVYLFTVRYENINSIDVKSLGRHYVLQFEGGKSAHFSCPTPHDSFSQFILKPGGKYTFCWLLFLGRPLLGVSGAATFQRLDGTLRYEQGFTNAAMEMVRPEDNEEIDSDGVNEKMKGSRYFSGFLDLRSLRPEE